MALLGAVAGMGGVFHSFLLFMETAPLHNGSEQGTLERDQDVIKPLTLPWAGRVTPHKGPPSL